jgi:hypothetical protein
LAFWPSFCLSEKSFPEGPSPLACFFRASIGSSGSVVGRWSNRVFPPLTSACFQQGPFAPRSLPASPLLWASPTPGRCRARGYVFPQIVGCVSASTPPGLPGSSTNLSLRAVPNHPGKPSDVLLPLLHHWWQASPSSAGWPSFIRVTRPNRVHSRYSSQVRFARLRLNGLLRCSLAQLHVERVIHMVDSFHSTRFASLTGTPKAQRDTAAFSGCESIVCLVLGDGTGRRGGEFV